MTICKNKWTGADSNRGHPPFQGGALPPELPVQKNPLKSNDSILTEREQFNQENICFGRFSDKSWVLEWAGLIVTC